MMSYAHILQMTQIPRLVSIYNWNAVNSVTMNQALISIQMSKTFVDIYMCRVNGNSVADFSLSFFIFEN